VFDDHGAGDHSLREQDARNDHRRHRSLFLKHNLEKSKYELFLWAGRADLHKQADEMADMESVSMHYKLGTLMGMNDSMAPPDFSRTFDLAGSRSKWVTALADLFSRPESEHYEGLYIRWLYPGCPNVIILHTCHFLKFILQDDFILVSTHLEKKYTQLFFS
jgi:hypothetical protein